MSFIWISSIVAERGKERRTCSGSTSCFHRCCRCSSWATASKLAFQKDSMCSYMVKDVCLQSVTRFLGPELHNTVLRALRRSHAGMLQVEWTSNAMKHGRDRSQKNVLRAARMQFARMPQILKRNVKLLGGGGGSLATVNPLVYAPDLGIAPQSLLSCSPTNTPKCSNRIGSGMVRKGVLTCRVASFRKWPLHAWTKCKKKMLLKMFSWSGDRSLFVGGVFGLYLAVTLWMTCWRDSVRAKAQKTGQPDYGPFSRSPSTHQLMSGDPFHSPSDFFFVQELWWPNLWPLTPSLRLSFQVLVWNSCSKLLSLFVCFSCLPFPLQHSSQHHKNSESELPAWLRRVRGQTVSAIHRRTGTRVSLSGLKPCLKYKEEENMRSVATKTCK